MGWGGATPPRSPPRSGGEHLAVLGGSGGEHLFEENLADSGVFEIILSLISGVLSGFQRIIPHLKMLESPPRSGGEHGGDHLAIWGGAGGTVPPAQKRAI